MQLGRTTRRVIVVLAVGALLGGASTAIADDDPQILRAIAPPPGFSWEPYARVPTPTSLTWSEQDTLYVTSLNGNVYAVEPGQGEQQLVPKVFASGLSQPLGVVTGSDGSVYVSDSYQEGGLTWGRVRVFTDADGDGVADADATVVDGLPNGRHNTNGLAFGPDGLLYVTNGNRTDDGLECGPPPIPADCGNPGEAQPLSGSLLRVDPDGRDQPASADMVVATGMRNVYDVAFWPNDPSVAYLPVNGPDDPAADDVLYATRVDDDRVDDMGFPSCLFNAHGNDGPAEIGGHGDHGTSLEPMDNPDPDVIAEFGACPVETVTRPVATFGGHVSADGLAFAHGSGFPGTYGNDLYVAEWGNLWGAEDGHVAGHKIVRVNLRDDGTIVHDHHGMPWISEFATGALPIDIAFGPDGAMYVADNGGMIHRIAWTGTAPPPDDEADAGHPDGEHGHGGGDDGHGHLDDHGDHEHTTDGEAPECPAGMAHQHNPETGRTECTAFRIGESRGTWEPATEDDEPGPTPGDRGLAWRWHDDSHDDESGGGGGHHRDGDFDPGCSDAAVDELVTRMTTSLARYDNDPWAAGSDGFFMYPIGWKSYHMFATSRYDDEHIADPDHVEAFMYAMTDDGLKAMGGMFTLGGEYKAVPEAELPTFKASNGEECRLPWHNHTGHEGLATSFDPEKPAQSNWMAHVWIHGLDTWERGVDGSEANAWWAPYRATPAICNDTPSCL